MVAARDPDGGLRPLRGQYYTDAIADADRFIELYPGNSSAAYAYYLKAKCYFEQIVDVGRDQGATQQALTAETEVAAAIPHTRTPPTRGSRST